MDRKDLQELSRVRLREARALLRAGLPDGAYYLAGYAVECALKACIAKSTRRGEFPDKKRVDQSYSHNLALLSQVAGLDKAIATQASVDGKFGRGWRLLQDWSEQSRYRRHLQQDATELLDAVGNPRHGVVSWIKKRW